MTGQPARRRRAITDHARAVTRHLLHTVLAVLLLVPSASTAAGAQTPLPGVAGVTPSVAVGDVLVREINGAAVSAGFPVSLSAPALTPVSVGYATRGGDAADAADFTPASGTLTLQPGQTRGTIAVPIADDRLGENAEHFTLVLSDPSGASLGRAVGAGTIVDDDALAVRRAPRVTMTVAPTPRGSTLVRGRVLPPAGSLTSGCSSSQVSVTVLRGKHAIQRRVVGLDPACAYRVRLRPGRGRLRVIARFEGSEHLRPASRRPAALRPY
jgi:hypothetical protein